MLSWHISFLLILIQSCSGVLYDGWLIQTSHFFVHLDAKTQAKAFFDEVKAVNGVHFVSPRLRVMWAAFSQVESTLLTIKSALNSTTSCCTHMVIISGADYPLTNNSEIIDFFQANKKKQFIRRFLLINSDDARQMWRVRGTHFRELADRFTHKRKIFYLLEQIMKLNPKPIPADFEIALGSNWVALTRECASYCVNEAEKNTFLSAYFRHAFGPDEMFLHTIVQNSSFVSEADPVEPYFDITTPGGPFYYGNVHALVPKVPITSQSEAERILENRNGKLFTRKLSSAHSEEALSCFDRAIER